MLAQMFEVRGSLPDRHEASVEAFGEAFDMLAEATHVRGSEVWRSGGSGVHVFRNYVK